MQKKFKWTSILLSVVSGWGHLAEGYELRGLVFFSLFATGCFGLFIGLFVFVGDGKGLITAWSSGVLFTVWGLCLVDITRETYGPRRARREKERSERLRQGIIHYLRSEYEDAESCFLENLRRNPRDAEALFRLGVVARRRGQERRALRYLKRCLRADVEGKWRWEATNEIQGIHAGA